MSTILPDLWIPLVLEGIQVKKATLNPVDYRKLIGKLPEEVVKELPKEIEGIEQSEEYEKRTVYVYHDTDIPEGYVTLLVKLPNDINPSNPLIG